MIIQNFCSVVAEAVKTNFTAKSETYFQLCLFAEEIGDKMLI